MEQLKFYIVIDYRSYNWNSISIYNFTSKTLFQITKKVFFEQG
jgi:hypothetical protein